MFFFLALLLAQAPDIVQPTLRNQMELAAPGTLHPAYLVMQDQLSLRYFEERTGRLSRAERRAFVCDELRRHSRQSQEQVQAVLQQAAASGQAERIRTIWIGNAVSFHAEATVIEQLAALPGVDRIRVAVELESADLADQDTRVGVDRATPAPTTSAGGGSPLASHLPALQADQLWAAGYDGTGILVGNIDSGVNPTTHPDLVNRVWTNSGETPGNLVDDDLNDFVDDTLGWDFWNDDNDPDTGVLHGTQAAGLMVGDGSNGLCTGVAPGGTMMILAINQEDSFWLAQQYCVDNGVDVISASLSYKWPFPRPDYHMHRQVCDMELAAGIIHAQSPSNAGEQLVTNPIPFNVSVPANCPSPWGHPDAEAGGRSSVLACGGVNIADDSLYLPTAQGPVAWEDITQYDATYPHTQDTDLWDYPYGGFGGGSPGLIKPDLMAYTNSVWTTSDNGVYGLFNGTSASTPQLGGGLMLLRQVQPEALPRHLTAALEITAQDLGPAGKDNRYGSGKIQLFDAARRLVLMPRLSNQNPNLGESFTLDIFGEPGTVFGIWVGPNIRATNSWNLMGTTAALGLFVLNGSGQGTLNLNIPSTNPALAGLDVYFLLMGIPQDPKWGPGNLLSVPELMSIGN